MVLLACLTFPSSEERSVLTVLDFVALNSLTADETGKGSLQGSGEKSIHVRIVILILYNSGLIHKLQKLIFINISSVSLRALTGFHTQRCSKLCC